MGIYYFRARGLMVPSEVLNRENLREFVREARCGHAFGISEIMNERLRPATIEEISCFVHDGKIKPPSDSRYGNGRVYYTGTLVIGDEVRPASDWELHNIQKVKSWGASLECIGASDLWTIDPRYVLVKPREQPTGRKDIVDALIGNIDRVLGTYKGVKGVQNKEEHT